MTLQFLPPSLPRPLFLPLSLLPLFPCLFLTTFLHVFLPSTRSLSSLQLYFLSSLHNLPLSFLIPSFLHMLLPLPSFLFHHLSTLLHLSKPILLLLQSLSSHNSFSSPSCPTCPRELPCQEEVAPSRRAPVGAFNPPLLHRVPRADVDDVVAPEAQNPAGKKKKGLSIRQCTAGLD